MARRPHVLGVDDAPFDKWQDRTVPVVGVLMEGNDLIEGVAIGAFPVDGEHATSFLAQWIGGLRWRAAIQGVVLGGITLAGLGLVDLEALAAELGIPAFAVTRRDPAQSRIPRALIAAGLADRLEIASRSPRGVRVSPGLYVAMAGTAPAQGAALVRATIRKSRLPEPLRVAHLIGAALARGQSRGRV
ncbi:MAG: endonuclease dU [Gemmatimonadales bacterium]